MKKKLTKEQHHILIEKSKEPPFKNKYWDNKKKGKYYCAQCCAELFSSEDKFDSGCGWPSFTKPVKQEKVDKQLDFKLKFTKFQIVNRRASVMGLAVVQ